MKSHSGQGREIEPRGPHEMQTNREKQEGKGNRESEIRRTKIKTEKIKETQSRA